VHVRLSNIFHTRRELRKACASLLSLPI
jgi:hypothetical protein